MGRIAGGRLIDLDYMKSQIRIDPSTGCWIWEGSKVRGGYGGVWGKRLLDEECSVHRAHRVMWELQNGEIPDDKPYVLHSCNTPACVNPSHLRVGTQQDNMRDRNNSGRQAKGSANGRAVLTEADVLAIRHLHATTQVTLHELGARFSTSPSNVHRIVTRDTWRHL